MPSLFEFVTEELLNEEEANQLTVDLWPEFAEVWKSSWKRWREMQEDDRRRICETPTARPVLLNAYAQSFAKEAFKDREDDGLVICDAIPGVFAIYVHRKVLIRFNGLTSSHIVRCASSSDTKHMYFLQEPLAKLDNTATRITCGYTLDPAKVDIENIELSLQVGEDPVYHFQIDDEASGIHALPEPTSSPALKPPVSNIGKQRPR